MEPVARFAPRFSVHYDPELWRKRGELEELMAGALAIIVRNATKVDAALIAGSPKLKVIGRHGVGLDNIDLAACKARGVAVCPATGANSVAAAECDRGGADPAAGQRVFCDREILSGNGRARR